MILKTTFFVIAVLGSIVTYADTTKPATKAVENEKLKEITQEELLALIRNKQNEDTDSGVVIDQTLTVAGRDFFQHFINAWRDKEKSDQHSILIRERPTARWGSEVWIEYGHRPVFYTRLSVSRSGLKQMAEEAAEMSYQNVLQAIAQRNLSESDFAADEF